MEPVEVSVPVPVVLPEPPVGLFVVVVVEEEELLFVDEPEDVVVEESVDVVESSFSS